MNSINPVGTETEGAYALGVIRSDFERQLIAQSALGLFGQPNDIAPIAVILASDASGWLTGENPSRLRRSPLDKYLPRPRPPAVRQKPRLQSKPTLCLRRMR